MAVLTTEANESSTPAVRAKMAMRLVHLIGMPGSHIPPSERHVTADLLVEVLDGADTELRVQCARRISALAEPPSTLVRLLARDEIEVAAPLLEDCKTLSDADLVAIAQGARTDHRRMIAARPEVSQLVAAALTAFDEPDVIETLLRNNGAGFSSATLRQIVADSRRHSRYVPLIATRLELRPDLALAMFWWAEPPERQSLLKRFAVSRSVLQEALTDVFAMAAKDGWSDQVTRRALQFVERRQRNRVALQRSVFESLEEAISTVEREGLNQELSDEISYLCGVKPMTGSRIFNDLGGEPLGVLCKAVGLKRDALRTLWLAGERAKGETGAVDALFERTEIVFDTLSVDKAQTVLRYWNWSLTAAVASTLRAVSGGGDGDRALDGASLAHASSASLAS